MSSKLLVFGSNIIRFKFRVNTRAQKCTQFCTRTRNCGLMSRFESFVNAFITFKHIKGQCCSLLRSDAYYVINEHRMRDTYYKYF